MLRLSLEVARRDHAGLDEKRVRAEIDRLALRYVRLRGDTPASRADAFRKLLFDEERFEAVADLESSRTLHLDTVLANRRGHCLSLSIVALAVAERVGAPLHGVAAPNHFFVRYVDGAFRRNLELTRKGAEVPDREFRRRIGEKSGLYLRHLTREEIRAYLIHNRGYVALVEKRLDDARADFEAALRLLPELNEAHRNLGVLLGERKQWAAAKRSFVRALALYPRDVDALINLAICRHALGDLQAANQDLEMALALDPERDRARALLREWAVRHGNGPRAGAPALPKPPPGLRPGLRGRYYAGIAFERLVVERIDKTIDFDWKNRRPAPGVPGDRFSIRWTGYFKAPRSGTYTVFLAANDGCRFRIGDTIVIENWKDMAYRNWYGSKDVHLEAGWHPVRIEHFDSAGGARILLRVGVEGRRDPLPLADHLFHTPG